MIARAQLPLFSDGQRIGLYGGSFNPAHGGHFAVAEEALKSASLDWVWWLVSPQNPLKDPKDTEDFSRRLALATEVAAHPRFRVTDFEKRIGSRMTADTLDALEPLLPRARFIWIMGADSLASLHHWHQWRKLPETLPLLVVDRPGWTFPALNSPAAIEFRRFRVKEFEAPRLFNLKPPAWIFVTLPLRKESSSEIRKATVTLKSHAQA
jgi:nicotinate-nucleotide adenylyltransferase